VLKGIKYEFMATPWPYSETGAWVFVSLPMNLSGEIRNLIKTEEEGWGRLKVTAATGNSEWKTAIWFDTKSRSYLLPLKAAIRKKENITTGKPINIVLWI
jgi:hypothetical protein